MSHPRPKLIDPIHSRIRTQTPHPLLSHPKTAETKGTPGSPTARRCRPNAFAERCIITIPTRAQNYSAGDTRRSGFDDPFTRATGQAASPKVETRVRAPNPRNAREPLVWETSAVATTARRRGGKTTTRLLRVMFFDVRRFSFFTSVSTFLRFRLRERQIFCQCDDVAENPGSRHRGAGSDVGPRVRPNALAERRFHSHVPRCLLL